MKHSSDRPLIAALTFVCVCVCVLSHWVHAAIDKVPDLTSLKCSSHWPLGLYIASVALTFVVIRSPVLQVLLLIDNDVSAMNIEIWQSLKTSFYQMASFGVQGGIFAWESGGVGAMADFKMYQNTVCFFVAFSS